MGVGPIPWTAIVEYMEYNWFDDDMRERFAAGVKVMDGIFVEKVNGNSDR